VSTVIELLSKQLIPIGSLQQITYSGWLHSLETEQIRSLLEVVRKQSDDAMDAVQLLEGFLRLHPESAAELADFSIWALGVPMQRTGRHSTFVWAELAIRYVDHAPSELGRITLNQIGTLQTAHDGEMNKLLRASWNLSDKKEFFEQLISPLLVGRSIEAWWSRQILASIPLAEVGVDYLISWVRSDPSNRAFPLARVIGAPTGRPSDLHARLLEEFDEFGVGSAFSAEYNSGSWTGSMEDWTRGKLTAAKLWLTDERPAVQKWGRWMVANLEESLRSAAASEAEERLIRY
jgi:hypothetical protein